MYKISKWLNSKKSSSTGTIVAFHDKDHKDYYGSAKELLYLEVGDCHMKVRLHKTPGDTTKDFIRKLKIIHTVVGDFIHYLESL